MEYTFSSPYASATWRRGLGVQLQCPECAAERCVFSCGSQSVMGGKKEALTLLLAHVNGPSVVSWGPALQLSAASRAEPPTLLTVSTPPNI